MTRLMYDSVNPGAIPSNAPMVAGYIDGTSYRWPDSAWNRFPNSVKVRIARRTTTNDGHVLDVEFGIPTVWPPSIAIVNWVQMRRRSGVEPTIYCNQINDWPGILKLFSNAGVRQPQYWVARYNNVRDIPSGAVAKQFSDPPISGGNYDLSVAADYWPGVDGEETTAMNEESIAAHLLKYPMANGKPEEAFDKIYRRFDELCDTVKAVAEAHVTLHNEVQQLSTDLKALLDSGVTLKASGEIVVKPELAT